MLSATVFANRPAGRRGLPLRGAALTLCWLWALGAGGPVQADQPTAPRDYSGWRGGIGITFGSPSRDIADVTELGYEIAWGTEDPRAIKTLGLSVFRYWNSIVETSLKGAGYDFSEMADKDEAARLAFDAWMERTYGVKGLSKFATVRYNPKASYGDVYGAMDLSSENALVKAVMDRYLRDFERDGVTRGGIGLDNAGKVPREFLETLARRLNAKGLGIAANGCPDEYLPYIDFFGGEGFPFSIQYARRAREMGLRGILGEFTLQHLSGGELDAYLKSKLFNDIVFFGYTNGGTAAGARYSAYRSRPDVYDHQRWVLRRLVPISRDVQRAGRQADPGAKLATAAADSGPVDEPPTGVKINAEGKVVEWNQRGGLDRITGRFSNTKPAIARFGDNIADGLYLFVDSGRPEEVICDARKLGVGPETLVFDEFGHRLLDAKREGDTLTFSTFKGPGLVRLADSTTLAKGILGRVAESLRQQLTQRELDREFAVNLPRRAWATFCQPAKWEAAEARSGKSSLAAVGGTFTGPMPQWKYFNRQGASQFVTLNQAEPAPIVARAFSKSRDVAASEKIALDAPESRWRHFDAREGHSYALRLYLDYQDGQWPEVHSAEFSPGSHDWEERVIRVEPSRPVKTALLLLEFHQPEGAAWFDDLSLTSGSEDGPNLLAAPGFELEDPIAAQAQKTGDDHERRTRALLDSVDAAAKANPNAETLAALGRQIDELAASVTDKGLAPYFARGLRDLNEAREQLELCARLLNAGR